MVTPLASERKSVRYNEAMHIAHNISLREYSTMRLGGIAQHVAEIRSRDDLVEALAWAKAHGNVPVLMIGEGSNIVWRDEGFDGLLMINRIRGFKERVEGNDHFVTIGAGEMWDEIVGKTAAAGLHGIEALSLIPGTAGATPVQNVGAYGQEIADTLVNVEAYDRQLETFVTIPAAECAFGYRTSRFKVADRGRFLITAITLHLKYENPKPPFYNALQAYLDEHNVKVFTPQVVRDAVIAIRQSKLPDPKVVANNGSFFGNPIVSETKASELLQRFPDMPHWPLGDGEVKIPAAWLVAEAGFKDYHDIATGMGTWPAQSLVLVNEHAKRTGDLLTFRQKILEGVEEKFGVNLEQEPELLP
ncbi:MAG TPA: UDP-N-acetylmuramate dehydrogenase [Candidatus Saccharimonadales bacterium]